MNLIARTGSDIYRLGIDEHFAEGNIQDSPGGAGVDPNYFGALLQDNDYSNQNNSDVLLTMNRPLGSRLNISSTVGGTVRREAFNSNGISKSHSSSSRRRNNKYLQISHPGLGHSILWQV